MAEIVKTGVFATEEETARMRDWASTPLIGPRWDQIHDGFAEEIDRLAMAHGLPAPEKDADGDAIHYGMTGKGEFTRLAMAPSPAEKEP